MAATEAPGFRSVWIGAPEVPWQLWRNLAEESRVHLYSRTGDYLMANERFAALYAITAGEKRIALPGPHRVTDAMTGDVVASETREIVFAAEAGETRSFVLDPAGD